MERVEAIQAEAFADDVPIHAEMTNWTDEELSCYFASGGQVSPNQTHVPDTQPPAFSSSLVKSYQAAQQYLARFRRSSSASNMAALGSWGSTRDADGQAKKLAANLDTAVTAGQIGISVPPSVALVLGELCFRAGDAARAAEWFQEAVSRMHSDVALDQRLAKLAGGPHGDVEANARFAFLGLGAAVQRRNEQLPAATTKIVSTGAVDPPTEAMAAAALDQARQSFQRETFGDMRSCNLAYYDRADGADVALVLLHGLTQRGDDLRGPGEQLQQLIGMPCRLLLPQARLQSGGGFSWRDDNADRSDPFRWASVIHSLAQIHAVCDHLRRDGVPSSRIIVGGFSQGTLISSLLAMTRRSEPLCGLLLLGGSAGGRVASLVRVMNGPAPPPKVAIFIGHGEQDHIAPIQLAKESLRDLKALGVSDLELSSYAAGHEIPEEMIRDCAKRVRSWVTTSLKAVSYC